MPGRYRFRGQREPSLPANHDTVGGQDPHHTMNEPVPVSLPSAHRSAELAREVRDKCEELTVLLAEAATLGLRVEIRGEQIHPQGEERPHTAFVCEVLAPLI